MILGTYRSERFVFTNIISNQLTIMQIYMFTARLNFLVSRQFD
jgi:hypothetical protein